MRAMRSGTYSLAVTLSAFFGVVTAQGDQTPPASAPADLVKQGRALNNAGRQDEALALYRQALAADANFADAHLAAGIALDLKGDYAEARTHLARAIELASPDNRAQALTAMAVSYAFEARAADAARYYQQVFDSQTAAQNFTAAAGSANALGRIYLESGDHASALRWYRTGYESARRRSDLPAAELGLWEMRWHHAQARIDARAGRPARAREHVAAFQALLAKRPPNADETHDHQYLLGYVALHTGEPDAAIAELGKGNLTDPFILGLLAQAWEKKGDQARAREFHQKVLESNAHTINTAFTRPVATKKLRN